MSTEAELEGATTVPPEGVMLGSSGEFAARWNGMEPAQREAVWAAMQGACNDGYRCRIEDHESLKEQLRAKNLADWQAVDQVENLLADELYDGGLGAKSESEMESYRQALALKLVRAFGAKSAKPPGEPSDAWQQEHGRHWWACAVNAPRPEWRGLCDCDLSRDSSLSAHPAALRAASSVTEQGTK